MLVLALALAVGVLAQSVARHIRIPGIVLLLAVGASLGPDGLGWVQPRTSAMKRLSTTVQPSASATNRAISVLPHAY